MASSRARGLESSALGAATGFCLALVICSGIAAQRVTGTTPALAIAANALTTVASVFAVLATVRAFLTSFGASSSAQTRAPEEREDDVRGHRLTTLVLFQVLGALLGIVVLHVLLAAGLAQHPWLREQPRQVVNDLVAVFGVFAFVWGCAQKPIRLTVMIAGLGLVLGYELTASYWHLDAPLPAASAAIPNGTFWTLLPWNVQGFVGGEVTASAIGLLAFRMLLA